ncbi:hypothetical protein LR48_Vigan04g199800 [Vigna angularis]|uniref:Uncharacterized protein n=1 Tax=Phaseolus angularis TaxID=3914 RepID=A0A0L9UFV9_PHAAN|nr:hypothetical protein LR48_Vigan04g199800 [Vigna angularis]
MSLVPSAKCFFKKGERECLRRFSRDSQWAVSTEATARVRKLAETNPSLGYHFRREAGERRQWRCGRQWFRWRLRSPSTPRPVEGGGAVAGSEKQWRGGRLGGGERLWFSSLREKETLIRVKWCREWENP